MTKMYQLLTRMFPGWFIGVGDYQLVPGSRINTPFGMATITGGAINVRLDTPRSSKNGSLNTGHTLNLNEVVERQNARRSCE